MYQTKYMTVRCQPYVVDRFLFQEGFISIMQFGKVLFAKNFS